MRKFISWLVPSFEGGDNKSSFRRLSAFALLALILHNGIKGLVVTMIGVYALIIYALTFLLLVGIITADNIIQFLKNRDAIKPTKDTEVKDDQV